MKDNLMNYEYKIIIENNQYFLMTYSIVNENKNNF